MKATGYSGTPLAKKLGIKAGFKIKIVNQPAYYYKLFKDFPSETDHINDVKTKKDFIHYFAKTTAELIGDITQLRQEIAQNGIIWISWPKKASKVESDLNGNIVREIGLNNGLVDIKVCAIDETWSGLKFVIPVKDRT
ncbi:DUF3052 domain-containing protein [Maribacter polysiphoniae]|uniref:DUF3052 domain-containing protein n=1 Tax=Maribacter polysiphoniae TaxID=429344 RepID=UPI002355AC79|nr:DUF3052 domain-containing protein [Maribacter polysiphoniae]